MGRSSASSRACAQDPGSAILGENLAKCEGVIEKASGLANIINLAEWLHTQNLPQLSLHVGLVGPLLLRHQQPGPLPLHLAWQQQWWQCHG